MSKDKHADLILVVGDRTSIARAGLNPDDPGVELTSDLAEAAAGQASGKYARVIIDPAALNESAFEILADCLEVQQSPPDSSAASSNSVSQEEQVEDDCQSTIEALRESEERLRRIGRAGRIGLYEWNASRDIAFWSPEHYELLGLELGPPVDSERWAACLHPDDRERVLGEMAELLEEGRSGSYGILHRSEYRVVRPDGSVTWLEADATIHLDGSDLVLRGTARDITERKQTEEALRESEETYHAFFENVAVGAAQMNPDGTFAEVNDRLCEMTGYSREQLLGGMTPNDLTHPEDREATRGALQEYTAGKITVYSAEKRYVRKDGAVIWVHVTAGMIHDTSGRPVRSAGVVQEITKRKQAQEALRELNTVLEQRVAERTAELARAVEDVQAERQRFLDMLDTLPVVIDIIRADHRIEWANRAYRDAFGDCQGQLCYKAQFGIDEPCSECQAFTPLQTGKPHHWEWTLPDGRTFDIHNFAFAAEDGDPAILEMDIDVTAQRRAEAALRNINETLEQRVAERTAALRESEEKYRALFDSMSEGFLLCEIICDENNVPVDYVYLDANAALEEQWDSDPQTLSARGQQRCWGS